ncbi:MAG: DUF2203 family protein [Planctomycetota bacterium]
MRHPYDPKHARALAPLLDSISGEIEERSLALEALEGRIHELKNSPFYAQELRMLEAEAAAHRRELHQCRNELERLGCTVLGTTPITIRIPTMVGKQRKSVVWQHIADD